MGQIGLTAVEMIGGHLNLNDFDVRRQIRSVCTFSSTFRDTKIRNGSIPPFLILIFTRWPEKVHTERKLRFNDLEWAILRLWDLWMMI